MAINDVKKPSIKPGKQLNYFLTSMHHVFFPTSLFEEETRKYREIILKLFDLPVPEIAEDKSIKASFSEIFIKSTATYITDADETFHIEDEEYLQAKKLTSKL